MNNAYSHKYMNIMVVFFLLTLLYSSSLVASPVDSLLNKGIVAFRNGDFQQAKKDFQQAYLYSDDYISTARILNNLGVLYQQQFKYDSALIYYSRLENILKENGDYNNLVKAYNNKAITYKKLKDYERSLDYYQKALVLSSDEEMFSLLNNIGSIYFDISKPDSSLAYLQQAEMYVQKPKRLKLYKNIATALQSLKKNDKSQLYFKKAFSNISNSSLYDYLELLISYGDIYSKRDSLKKAVKLSQELKIENITSQAYYYLALTYNNPDSSLFYLKQITNKNIAPNSLNAWINIEALAKIANIYYQQGNLTQALKCYQTAINKFGYNKRIFTSNEDKKEINDKYAKLFISASEVCLKLYEQTKNDSLLYLAFDYADMIKASIFKEQVKSKNIPDSVLLTERRLNARIEKGEAGAVLEKEKFIEKLKTDYPAYYENRFSFKTGVAKDLSAKLNKEQQVLSYIYSDSLLLRFTVTPNGLNAHKQKIDTSFTNAVKNVAYYVRHTNTHELEYHSFIKASNLLYTKLFPDEMKKELIIIPWKGLYKISFDCLFKTDSMPPTYYFRLPYLVYNHAVSYHFAASLLDFKERKAKTAYLYAPDYAGTKFEPLTEGDDVQAIKFFIEEPETVPTIELKGDIFHLAVHGSPGYIYTKNDSLSISDISSMQSNNLLTMLTACQSAEGRVNTEGEESFARALLQAGSQSAIVSEWTLVSSHNKRVFFSFYNELAGGEKLNIALQRGKIFYLDYVRPFERHPYFWSSLTVYGNTEKLKGNKISIKYFIAFGVFAFLLLYFLVEYFKRKR